jgi:competence protein ComEC
MAMLYLVGKLTGRHASGLNLLGVALLVEVILDPLIAAHLGFQLSFLSCVGILLFRPLFAAPLLHLLPTHSPSTLTPLDQHVYLLSSFLRQGLSINLAVNLAILPLLLLNFHQFPLLALLYNLFFPFLVSAALFGLLITLLLQLLAPPLATLSFPLIDAFTAQLLDLAAYPPLPLDYSLTIPNFPAWIIPLYLFGLFCISITYRKTYEN